MRLSPQTVNAKDFIDAPALEVAAQALEDDDTFRFGSTAGGARQLITAVHKRRCAMVGPTTGQLRGSAISFKDDMPALVNRSVGGYPFPELL
jgi:hypothetical protein